jgi:hypothetical protein
VLDWTESPSFAPDLAELVRPVQVTINDQAAWMPRGRANPREARLESFGPRCLKDACDWRELTGWWLKRSKGANTPNWDIACPATINGTSGVILVEAKANISEFSAAGKPLAKTASDATRANHDRIQAAIGEAQTALASSVPGIGLSRDHHYQLSNRIAFAWKLASLGVPTVLVYLAFLRSQDFGTQAVYTSDRHWRDVFADRARSVWPATPSDDGILTGAAQFWMLIRSRAADATHRSSTTRPES